MKLDVNRDRKFFFDDPKDCYASHISKLQRIYEADKPHEFITVSAGFYDLLLTYFNYWHGALAPAVAGSESKEEMLAIRDLIIYDLLHKEESRLSRLKYKAKKCGDVGSGAENN